MIVQPPGVAVVLEDRGEVRERLPRDDRIAAGRGLHAVERVLRPADVRQRLRVQQDALVAAEALGDAPRLVHDPRRERAPLRVDRQRREHQHRGVGAQEHQLHEVVDREADARIVLAAVLLREALPEVDAVEDGVQVVLQQVPLDVEHELLAPDHLVRGLELDRGLRRDVVAAAGLAGDPRRVRAMRLARAGVEHQERGRRAADREQELAPRHAEPLRVRVARLTRAPDRLGQDGRQERFRVVLRVRGGPERDRQPGVLVAPVSRSVQPAPFGGPR